ncbi:non-ribosomal peptide synthetase, partial [Archangium sp.]|uniref:non-ribosomal peptide synthetase n=1 Tax=Archangium sp. TaxID=1872627 RepID=UPI002D709AAF
MTQNPQDAMRAEQDPNSSSVPCSLLQEHLWNLEQGMAGSGSPCVQGGFRLLGTLEVAALERGLDELIRRHQILRTCFSMVDGTLAQSVEEAGHLALTVVELSRAAEEELEAAAEEHARRPFDASRGPLVRATLLRLGSQEHVLLLCMHRLIADEACFGVLGRELAALYGAFCAGRTPRLPEPAQYGEFAREQRSRLRGETLEGHLGFWKQQLAGATPAQLPTDLPPSQARSGARARHPFMLPHALVEALRALEAGEADSLRVTLLAAFRLLLHRHAHQQEDMSLGVLVPHERPELLGPVASPLVLRTPLMGNPTFHSLRSVVRGTLTQALAHRELPFEAILEALRPAREPGLALLQALVIFEEPVSELLQLPELSFVPLDTEGGVTPCDLVLKLSEGPGELCGALEYNAELFRADTISWMVERFQRLLESIAAHPEQRVMDLPMMREEERRQVLEAWNRTEAEYPREASLPELFEAQVRRTPRAVAVEYGGQRLTYEELNRRANQLAHHLRGLGVGPEVRVGLSVERSLELVVSLVGILKAGGVYVPLDASYPRERLEWMRSEADLAVLVTQEKRVPAVSLEEGTPVVRVDTEWEALIARQPEESPKPVCSGGNLAYVMFTSGSTGKPKGVGVPHRAVSRLVLGGVNYAHFGPEEVLLQLAPIAFDASTLEVWGALLHGAKLVVYPAGLPSLEELGRVLVESGVTMLFLTTALFDQMQAHQPEALSKVRQLMAGGEVMPVGRARERLARGGAFSNVYGPTENTTFSTYHRMENVEQVGATVSIGRPITNTTTYVLDEGMQPVPVGVAGELYVGGEGLAVGYLGRPELTAEKFVPHPYSAQPGERLYRTGDVVRWLPGGELEFIGRRDAQVKIRGFRIELGEIEAALAQHPTVSTSTVIVREDVPGSKRLVVYVVPEPGQQADATELRGFLKERLPEYMVPSAFVALEALPLTPNGKVDRRALPAPDWSRPEGEGEYSAPQTPVEKQLAAVWAKVLRLERVGRHDNFFELGGDSIIGMQILAHAHQAGLRFTSRQLFQHPTLAELAPRVVEVRGQSEQGAVTGPVPLTPIQHWFMELRQPEPRHFKQGMVFEVTERVEPALVERALRRLIEHHDALRMCFVQEGGQWRQVNGGQGQEVPLRRVDLASVPEEQRGAAIEAVAEELPEGFELSRGQLLGAALLDMGAGHNERLLLVIHHFVVDFVSWRVLLEDLKTAYQQLSRGEEVVLPPKTTSFKAWSERLEEYAQSALEEELAYWLEPRKQARALPVDRTGGANTQESARGVTLTLDAEQTRALLQEVPGAYRAQINDVLLTALAQALAQWTGSRQVLVDMEGHGREELFEDVNLSRTVGWFTTLFPVRLDLTEATSPASALGTVREELRRLPRRGIGYGLLRYLRKDDAAQGLKSFPRAEVSFNYWGQIDLMGQGAAPFVLSPESGGAEFGRKHRRPHLLAVEARVFGGRLEATWLYSENVHERATIESLAQGFMAALRDLIEGRTSPEAARYVPSDFPVARLDRAELERVLKQAPRVEDIYPLTSLQQGLLYQEQLAPGTDLYFVQVSWALPQALNVPAFQKAWERVVAQNPVLRTAFLREGLTEPLQVVLPSVALPLRQLDWRGVPATEKAARLASLVSEERARCFELSSAPLMRVVLVRVDEAAYHCLWSFHHLLLDGWSLGVVFQELYAHYEALASGKELPLKRGTPYREYIAWLRRQDFSRSEAYWRQALAGFTAPTPLPHDLRSGLPVELSRGLGERKLQLDTAAAAALQGFVRQHHLTLNTLVLAAWGLVLGRHAGVTDVVIGAILAGRPPELPGVDAIMGMFINTLPVRVRLEPQASVLSYLQRLQAEQDELRQHEHSPLSQVQAWSQVPRGTSQFDSLYSFENYPMD